MFPPSITKSRKWISQKYIESNNSIDSDSDLIEPKQSKCANVGITFQKIPKTVDIVLDDGGRISLKYYYLYLG